MTLARSAREQARDVLADRRFRPTPVPSPLRSVREEIGKIVRSLGRPFESAFRWAAGWFPGGSLLLSGVLMFEHLGWKDAADDIVRALEATIADKIVTYDFARMMDDATEVKCSEFASAIVDRL